MKKLFLLVALLLCPLASFAQSTDSPATADDVRKMFEATNTRKMFDAMMPVIAKDMPAMIIASTEKEMPSLNEEQRQLLLEYAQQTADNAIKSMPYQQMMEAMVPVYQKHFTHGDIQQVISFYNSPVGKKLIDQMPTIATEGMQAAMPVMQKWMDAQMEQSQKDAEEFARKLKATMTPKDKAPDADKQPPQQDKKK